MRPGDGVRCAHFARAEPVAGLYFGLSGFSGRSVGFTGGTGFALSIQAVYARIAQESGASGHALRDQFTLLVVLFLKRVA